MRRALVSIVGLLALASCNSSDPKYQGRAETKKLEAASLAGYDGTAMRKGVDNALNKTDKHSEDLDTALKSVGEE